MTSYEPSFAAPLSAERALDTVSRAVRSAATDAVEVTLLGRTGEYTRFAGDRIGQPQDITGLSVSIKAIVNGHAARAATSSLDRVAETALLAASLARSRAAAAGRAGSVGVAAPAEGGQPSLWHSDTAGFDAHRRVELAGLAMRSAAAVGASATGMIGRAVSQIAVANSAGVHRHAEATEASGSLTVSIGDATAHWTDLHRSSDALDTASQIDGTIERASRGRGRIELPDGEYTVVLGPQATGELLGFLGLFGFSGDLAAAGVGVWASQAGQRVASELVSVHDDALAPVGLPIGFDFEGTPKRRVGLLAAGVVGEPVTDLSSAASLGRPSTGHAHIAREEVPAPVPANLMMQAGSKTEAELIAGVERGVYVERFWYTRLVDRHATTITGVSRDGCFLIENGRLTLPLATGRFTQSVLGFLHTVDGLGDTSRSQPVMNVWNGCISAPAIRGHGFRFGSRPVRRPRG